MRRMLKIISLSLSVLVLFSLTSCSSNQGNRLKSKTPEERRADLYYTEGTRQLMSGEYTEALKNLLEAQKLRPEHSKTQNNLGMAYHFRGRTDLAIKHLRKAITFDEGNTDARINIASIYQRRNRLDRALEQYESILDDLTYSHHYRTYYNMALIYESKGAMDLALSHLEQSIDSRDDYCPALFRLGYIYYEQRSFDRAENYFRQASLGTCHKNPEPIFYRGLTQMRMHDFDRAKDLFEDVIEFHPSTDFANRSRRKIRQIQSNALRANRTDLSREEQRVRAQKRAQRQREALLGKSGPDELNTKSDKSIKSPSF